VEDSLMWGEEVVGVRVVPATGAVADVELFQGLGWWRGSEVFGGDGLKWSQGQAKDSTARSSGPRVFARIGDPDAEHSKDAENPRHHGPDSLRKKTRVGQRRPFEWLSAKDDYEVCLGEYDTGPIA
jgi:hypothetical protein